MVDAIPLFVGAILRLLRTRRRLLLENLALRQQIAVLKRKHTRPRLAALDKLFWVLVRRFWSEWKQALIIVGPETVVRWHRSGFAMYWRAISRGRRIVGRRRTSKEVRDLILRMVAENSTWGGPTYSRRTSHARFRYLGTNDFPLDETSAERPGASQTLACLSSKSPGGHRGDGPLYRSDHHLRCALLFLHHRPRSEAYREFQRYVLSDLRLDHSAVARGLPVSIGSSVPHL